MLQIDKDYSRKVAHWMVYEVIPLLRKHRVDMKDTLLTPQYLSKIIDMHDKKTISRETARYLIKGYITRDPRFIKEECD